MNARVIPEGYRQDARGALIPVEMIKPIDSLRDQTVLRIVEHARAANSVLVKTKADLFADVDSFVALSLEEYGVKLGGGKGNVTLMSFDGRYKVIKACPDVLVFDERLQAAKSLIDECLRVWTEGARPELRTLIDQAFEVDTAGKISVQRVLALRKLNINDQQWLTAMQAINDALQIVGRKAYVRVYERVEGTDEYRQITLDMAGV